VLVVKMRQRKPEFTAEVFAPANVSQTIAPDQRSRLGDVLLSEQVLSPEQLAAALNLQLDSGRQLGAILVEQGLLDPRALTRALGTQLGLPTVDLRRETPSPEALACVPETTAREFGIVPIRLADGVLDVAVADGVTPALSEALARLQVQSVNIYLAPLGDVQTALHTHYRVISESDDHLRQIWESSAPIAEEVIANDGDAPMIQLVNKIIAPPTFTSNPPKVACGFGIASTVRCAKC
jgi:hypothetical protein